MTISITEEQQNILVVMTGELDTPESIKIQPDIDRLVTLASKDIVIDCSNIPHICWNLNFSMH